MVKAKWSANTLMIRLFHSVVTDSVRKASDLLLFVPYVIPLMFILRMCAI
jgi:hypothetical protein